MRIKINTFSYIYYSFFKSLVAS
eukprot:gene20006-25979_t